VIDWCAFWNAAVSKCLCRHPCVLYDQAPSTSCYSNPCDDKQGISPFLKLCVRNVGVNMQIDGAFGFI
jgi:hypothetical protein